MTIHGEPAYADVCRGLDLPVTEQASDETLLLPLYAQMTGDEQDTVVRALAKLEVGS